MHTDSSTEVCKAPGEATAQDGFVILDGPDGVAVTMTANAADGTADSLQRAAQQARSSAEPFKEDDGGNQTASAMALSGSAPS